MSSVLLLAEKDGRGPAGVRGAEHAQGHKVDSRSSSSDFRLFLEISQPSLQPPWSRPLPPALLNLSVLPTWVLS